MAALIFLLHFAPVAGFQLTDGLVDFVDHVFLVAPLVSLGGVFGDVAFGGLQQWHWISGFFGGLKIIEGLALVRQVCGSMLWR